MADKQFIQKVIIKAQDETTAQTKRIAQNLKLSLQQIKDESKKLTNEMKARNLASAQARLADKKVREELDALRHAKNKLRLEQQKLGKSTNNYKRSLIDLRTVAYGFSAFMTGAFVNSLIKTQTELDKFERSLKVVAGSQGAAQAEMSFLRDESERLGLEFRSIAGTYSHLAAATKETNLTIEQTRDIFLGTAEAGADLGLSADDMSGALRAMQQMVSKGNVQAEELRGQLGERIPGAFNLAAKAMGVSTQQLNKMLEQGQVLAEDMLPKLAKELRNTFGEGAVEGANSLQGEINRLKNEWFDLKAVILESGVGDLITTSFRMAAKFIGQATKEFKDYLTTIHGGKEVTKENRLELQSLLKQYVEQKEALKDIKKLAQENNLTLDHTPSGDSFYSGKGSGLVNQRIKNTESSINSLKKQIKVIEGETFFKDVFDKKSYDEAMLFIQNLTHAAKNAKSETDTGLKKTKTIEDPRFNKENILKKAKILKEEQELLWEHNSLQKEVELEKVRLQYEIQELTISAQEDGYQKESELLKLHLDQKKNILLNEDAKNKEYVLAAEAKYFSDLEALGKNHAKKEKELNKLRVENQLDMVSNILEAGETLVQGNKKFAILNKIISIGQIGVNTARAVAQTLPNIPLSITVGAIGAAQAVKAASVKYAAKGADFITNGPQVMVVGENPGGKERVQVTPMSSPNINGPKQSGTTNNVSFGDLNITMDSKKGFNFSEWLRDNHEEFGREVEKLARRGTFSRSF